MTVLHQTMLWLGGGLLLFQGWRWCLVMIYRQTGPGAVAPGLMMMAYVIAGVSVLAALP